MQHTALLIIDVQNALFQPFPQPWQAEEVLQRIQQLAAGARAAQRPVVWVQHTDHADLAHGSAGWQLAAGIHAPATDLHIEKRTPDAFLRTSLSALLTGLHVRHVVVAGYASEFCIDTTVRSAAAHGLDVTLVADAHTTHDKAHASAETIRAHENATLPAIRSFGRRIAAVPTSAIDWQTLAAHAA